MYQNLRPEVAPQVGLEPTTLRLTGVTLRFFCGRNCSFFYYICATILKTSGRRVCGRFVAENVAIFLPQAPSKRHEYMQGALDLILHIIMQFDPSTICHIKSKGHEESKGDCAKAPRVISREEPFSLDNTHCQSQCQRDTNDVILHDCSTPFLLTPLPAVIVVRGFPPGTIVLSHPFLE